MQAPPRIGKSHLPCGPRSGLDAGRWPLLRARWRRGRPWSIGRSGWRRRAIEAPPLRSRWRGPVVQAAEQDLDAVASLASALIVSVGLSSSAWVSLDGCRRRPMPGGRGTVGRDRCGNRGWLRRGRPGPSRRSQPTHHADHTQGRTPPTPEAAGAEAAGSTPAQRLEEPVTHAGIVRRGASTVSAAVACRNGRGRSPSRDGRTTGPGRRTAS